MKGFTFVSFLLLATLLFVGSFSKNTGPSTTFTDKDAENLGSSIKAHQKEWEKSISQSYFAFSALDGKVSNKETLCALAKDTLSKTKRVEEIYYAVSIAEGLGCGESASAEVVNTLKDAVLKGEYLEDLYYAVNSVLLLQSKNHIKFTEDLTSVVSKVLALEDEGKFSNAESDEGSFYTTGLALQLLAKLRSKLSATEKSNVDDLFSKINEIVSQAGDDESTVGVFKSSHGELPTTSEVIRGVVDLADALKKNVNEEIAPELVSSVADYFVHFKQTNSPSIAYYFLKGLNALKSKSISLPVVLTLEQNTIDVKDKADVSVKVTDIFGKPVSSNVTLIRAFNTTTPGVPVLSGKDLGEGTGHHRLDFLGLAKPDFGFYTLNFKATSKGFSTVEPSRVLKVIGAAVPSDFELAVTDTKDSRIVDQAKHKVKHPETLKGTAVRVDKLQYLRVSFRVRSKEAGKPLLADQAFVKLTNLKTHTEAVFAAVANVNEERLYSLAIGIDENAPLFKYESGDYKLELIVGDALINPPFSWEAATVNLNFKNAPSAKATPAVEARRIGSLPEITHVFATPENLPTKTISNAFTIAVLSPFLVFLIGLLIVGANFKRLFSTSNFFFGVGFLTCITAVAALIVIYWLRLTMITTLGYLGVLSLPTIFFGNRALSNLAWERKEKQKST